MFANVVLAFHNYKDHVVFHAALVKLAGPLIAAWPHEGEAFYMLVQLVALIGA